MQATAIKFEYVNASEGHVMGSEVQPVSDTVLEGMTPGQMFRWLQREYGRCISRVYIDEGTPVGWCFQRAMPYGDNPRESYIQEVWVSLMAPDHTYQPRQYQPCPLPS